MVFEKMILFDQKFTVTSENCYIKLEWKVICLISRLIFPTIEETFMIK